MGTAWVTETWSMVLRRSKTLALVAFSTAVGVVDRSARFRKSKHLRL